MKIFHIISLSILAYFLSSCEEVITIDLNESEPVIVIEALLKDVPTGNQVIISQTGSYFEPGNYPSISGATIRLSDNEGNIEILQESPTQAGTYPILETKAEAGRTYQLEIEAEGQLFEAQSIMQKPFEIDSIFFETRNGPMVVDPNKTQVPIIRLQDPVGEDNFFLFEAVVNGELQPDLFLYDGRPTDGISATVSFITLSLGSGDSLQVNTYAIDQEAYEYYNTLASLVGGGFLANSATPANPTSNWSNGALGFFGTLAVSETELIVP